MHDARASHCCGCGIFDSSATPACILALDCFQWLAAVLGLAAVVVHGDGPAEGHARRAAAQFKDEIGRWPHQGSFLSGSSMTVITLQVGQCGNQLGQHLWKLAACQLPQPEAQGFFSVDSKGRLHARCIAIDTEPKVVNQLLQQDELQLFRRNRIITANSGCGNNWACGYKQAGAQGTRRAKPKPRSRQPAAWSSDTSVPDQQPPFIDRCMDVVRQQCEAADGAAELLLLHSLAGGTGSGLGSRILEELHDECPHRHITCASIMPSRIGDTAMQAVNCTMALSFLQEYSDVVLLFDDSSASSSSTPCCATNCASVTAPWVSPHTKASSSPDWQAGLGEVNGHIARTILGALWPLSDKEGAGSQSRMDDMVETFAGAARCKFVEAGMVWMHPNTPNQAVWMDGFRGLGRVYPRYDPGSTSLTSCTGAYIVGRGCSTAALGSSSHAASYYHRYTTCHAHSQLSQRAVQVQSCAKALRVAAPKTTGKAQLRIPGDWPSITAICQRSSVLPKLQSVANAANQMQQAGAYMHWFDRWGCSAGDVREACEHVLSVADDYSCSLAASR